VTTLDDLTLPVRRWPLWLGVALVLVSTGIIVAVFALSIDSSKRAATDRVLASQTISRLRTAQTDMSRAAETIATAILRRNTTALPGAAGHARSAVRIFEGEGGDLKTASGEWMRRYYAASAAAYSGDWPRANESLTRLVAEQGLTIRLARSMAAEDRKWESADAGMMASDARSRGFALPLVMAGVLLVVAAGLLGWLAAQAMRLYGRARRRSGLEERRANALEAAVRERTADLREANASLEREIQERSTAEAQLRQAQKMEAIGQLTGGIAHDFNNMLAVIVGGIELAKRKAAQPDQFARHLDRAMEGADRAVALTRRLLSFARSEPANARPISLTELVAGLSDMVERTLDERIRVTLRLEESLWATRIDRHQMENAILNLVVNARDAMPKGGELTISTANRPGEADRVELCVCDTGEGMDDATRERAMEPFFTTKAAGHGTGLGLSQIFGLVSAAGGEMELDSAPGAGTCVRLLFPAVPGDPSLAVERATPADNDHPVARQKILVVEDDGRVRRATVSALEEIGHRAIACSDGSAALALVRGGTAVDLIVSDVVMPGLSGPELANALEECNRSVPILFVTGYAATEAGDRLNRHRVLRKPFTIAQLSAAVSATLAAADAPPQPADV